MNSILENVSEEEFEAYKALVNRLTEDWVVTEKNLMRAYLDLEEIQMGCGGHPADESYYDRFVNEEENSNGEDIEH